MTTLTEIPIDKIAAHPKNIRRHAEADTEMVDSIKSHGLVQAVTVVTHEDGYWLIAGHRRVDGSKKAGLGLIPAMVRDDWDTEASHIEAMAIENLHREDLTPIEEAAGYEQLELLGYTADDIAKKTGRAASTVRSRLKLNTLNTAAKDAVHGHQITLDQASDLLRLEDRPELLAHVESTIGTDDFDWTLRRTVADADREAKNAEALAECEASGLPQVKLPNQWDWDYTNGPRPVYDGETADGWGIDSNGRATLVLTQIPKRVPSKDELAREAKWKTEQKREKERQAKVTDARNERLAIASQSSVGSKLATNLQPIARLGLAATLAEYQLATVRAIAAAAGVELEVTKKDTYLRHAELFPQIAALSPAHTVQLLAATLTYQADKLLGWADGGSSQSIDVTAAAALEYLDAVDALPGYKAPAVVKPIRTSITKRHAAATKKSGAA